MNSGEEDEGDEGGEGGESEVDSQASRLLDAMSAFHPLLNIKACGVPHFCCDFGLR